MKRIEGAFVAPDLFGQGKHGFRDGDPVAGIPATRLTGGWFNHAQEEIARVIEGTGAALNEAAYDQLKTAIEAMIADAIAALPPAESIPTGMLIWHTGAAPPSAQFVAAHGVLLDRDLYPELWTYAQASGNLVDEAGWAAGNHGAYSTGDGVTDFRTPDVRGEFIRGADAGRGIDVGRLLGSWQADEFKSHTHKPRASTSTGGTGSPANIYDGNSGAGQYGATANADMGPTTSSGGVETRGRNIAFLPCIRI